MSRPTHSFRDFPDPLRALALECVVVGQCDADARCCHCEETGVRCRFCCKIDDVEGLIRDAFAEALSDTTDGNHPPSGLRGDPDVPRTASGDTRDKVLDVPLLSAEVETLIQRVLTLARDIGTVLDVARRRSDPDEDHVQMMRWLDRWRWTALSIHDDLASLQERSRIGEGQKEHDG